MSWFDYTSTFCVGFSLYTFGYVTGYWQRSYNERHEVGKPW